MNVEEIGIITTAVVGAIGVLVFAWKIARVAWRGFRNLGHLIDELLGVEARGSRPAVPGWAARLDQIQGDVSKIRDQVFPNGGTSLRDAVDDVRHRFDEHVVEAASTHRLFVDHLRGVHVEIPADSQLTVGPSTGPTSTGPEHPSAAHPITLTVQ